MYIADRQSPTLFMRMVDKSHYTNHMEKWGYEYTLMTYVKALQYRILFGDSAILHLSKYTTTGSKLYRLYSRVDDAVSIFLNTLVTDEQKKEFKSIFSELVRVLDYPI